MNQKRLFDIASLHVLLFARFLGVLLGLMGSLVACDDPTDEKEEPTTILKPQSLGRIGPNQTGYFLMELAIPNSDGFEIKATRKSCVCTKVELLTPPLMQNDSKARVLVEVKATSGHGRQVGQFDLLTEKENQSRRIAQPFEYFIADEIDFGATEVSQILLADSIEKTDFRVMNHSSDDWSRGIAMFDFGELGIMNITFDIEPRKGVSQIVDFNVASLIRFAPKQQSREGTLRLFAQKKEDGAVLLTQVATRRIEVAHVQEVKVSPNKIILDKGSEQQSLHFIVSPKLPEIMLTNAKISCRCGDSDVDFQLVAHSPKWVELRFDPKILGAYKHQGLDLAIAWGSEQQVHFQIPVLE